MKPQRRRGPREKIWLALMIGNSRLHWAWFIGETLQEAWDTEYLPAPTPPIAPNPLKGATRVRGGGGTPLRVRSPLRRETLLQGCLTARDSLPSSPSPPLPLYLASVVPSQTALWQTYPDVRVITLDRIPLQGIYPTLGIDRALALWGAGETWGWPMLAIDAGTALTLTGADANRCLVGGAILPGLGLQLQSLDQRTAELPLVDTRDVTSLPPRWALNTPEAIQSGVIYTILAGIRDFIEAWRRQFPGSYITLTGGDRTLLLTYLQFQFPELAVKVISDRHLIFWGMRSCWALRRGQGEVGRWGGGAVGRWGE